MKQYIVRYETEEGFFDFEIEADGYASASDACYYEHGDEEGYKELSVIEK